MSETSFACLGIKILKKDSEPKQNDLHFVLVSSAQKGKQTLHFIYYILKALSQEDGSSLL